MVMGSINRKVIPLRVRKIKAKRVKFLNFLNFKSNLPHPFREKILIKVPRGQIHPQKYLRKISDKSKKGMEMRKIIRKPVNRE